MRKLLNIQSTLAITIAAFLFTLPLVFAGAQSESALLKVPAGQMAGNENASVIPPKEKMPAGAANASLADHLATVFNVKGDVKILKKNSEEWLPAKKNATIEQGDQILTTQGSLIEISYDKHFLNIARIEENTKAEFRSIEPTDLFLEDGAIFNALDGLGEKGHYQIATPTAVAGVQGTTFDITFLAASQLLQVNCFTDTSDHIGRVVVDTEGVAREILEGQALSQGVLGAISEDRAAHAAEIVQKLDENYGDERSQGLASLDSSEQGQKGEGKDRDDKSSVKNPPGGGGGGNGPASGPGGGGAPSQNSPLQKSSDGEEDVLIDQMLGEGPLGAGEDGTEDYGVGDHQNDLISQNSQHNGDIQNYVVQQHLDQTPAHDEATCGG